VGALVFLQKPFNDHELVDLINLAVDKKGALN
jgi:FixJ family two-component response regulator